MAKSLIRKETRRSARSKAISAQTHATASREQAGNTASSGNPPPPMTTSAGPIPDQHPRVLVGSHGEAHPTPTGGSVVGAPGSENLEGFAGSETVEPTIGVRARSGNGTGTAVKGRGYNAAPVGTDFGVSSRTVGEKYTSVNHSADPHLKAVQSFKAFIERYRDDPVGFAVEVLGMDLLPWQADFLKAVAGGKKRISIRAGHGVGKSAACSVAVVWHMVTRYPQKTVVTAPAAGQLFDVLYPEIKTRVSQLPPFVRDLFVVFTDRIVLKAELDRKIEESFVSAKTSSIDRPEAMAGVHSENVLLIFDEASGIPEAVYGAAAGSMSGHSAITILIGNPTRNSGYFHKTHHELRHNWHCMHVSCIGNRLVSEDFIKDVEYQWGEKSNEYRVKVLGEFPLAEDRVLIAKELVDAAMVRDVVLDPKAPLLFGVDVARFGDDRSVICKRQGNIVIEVKAQRGLDLMGLVGWVASEARTDMPAEIMVDSIGLGSGVADRLRELGFNVRDVNVSEVSSMNQSAYRLRDELWLAVKDWLNRRSCKLPRDEVLAQELVSVAYDYHSTGAIKVESKDSLKTRLKRSPDLADALTLTFAGESALVGGRAPSWVPGKSLRRGLRGIV